LSGTEVKDMNEFKVGEADQEDPIVTKRKENLKEFCESKGIKVQNVNSFRANLFKLNFAQLVEFCNLHTYDDQSGEDIWWLKLVAGKMTIEEKLDLLGMEEQKDILMAEAKEEYRISIEEPLDKEIQKIKDWRVNNQAESLFEVLENVTTKSVISAISLNDGLGSRVLKTYANAAALEAISQSGVIGFKK
jgi:hypothetical protein